MAGTRSRTRRRSSPEKVRIVPRRITRSTTTLAAEPPSMAETDTTTGSPGRVSRATMDWRATTTWAAS